MNYLPFLIYDVRFCDKYLFNGVNKGKVMRIT